MLRRAVDSILTSIYPQQCLVCGGLVETNCDGVACAGCWTLTRLFDGSENLCRKCGALEDRRLDASIAGCPNCHGAYYDAAVAAGVYEKALAAAIVHLKRKPELPRRLINLIEQLSVRIEQTRPSVIIPVPLSRSRRHERGFNQAEILADVISKHTGIEVTLTCLVRSKHTPMHRVAMDKRARELTVEKAFEVRSPRLFAGKDVVLVDDVFTSGATASACARVLKKNGALKVTVVTLARAVL
jgi:ComF family protein